MRQLEETGRRGENPKQRLEIEPEAERELSHRMRSFGETAGAQLAHGVETAFALPAATSPVGQLISSAMQALHGALAPTPTFVTGQSEHLGNITQTSIAAIETQDQQSSSMFAGPIADSAPVDAPPGQPADDKVLDPVSIEEEARAKADKMLREEMAAQLAGMGLQIGVQMAQQLSQQLSQVAQQVGQMLGQGGQMLGQMASEAAYDASAGETDAGSDLDWGDGLGAGGGAGTGDVGDTVPAGLAGPAVAPATASTALSPTAIPSTPSAATTAATAASRMPMMPPMMPMSPLGGAGSTGSGIGRDTRIFPDRKVFEPPTGVAQNFGAIPEIRTGSAAFGESKTTG